MPLREAFTFDDVVLEVDGRRLLDGVSDHIHVGACTAVVGPSGSGKSTFLRLLNRLDEPTSGTIVFDGVALPDHDVHRLRRRVGLVSQRPVMLASTVREELAVASPGLDDASARRLLRRVHLDAVADEQADDADGLGRATASMSGGEQQRLALARALAAEPDVLLLDEPTSALDDRAAAAVDAIIRELVQDGLTVVLVSHDLDRVTGVADHALVLDQGRLVDRGTPGDVDYLA